MSHLLWQHIPVGVVDQAVAQTFQMLIETDAIPAQFDAPGASDDITVAVYCDEHQQSAVMIRCSRELGKVLTSRMLESPAESLGDEDVRDATGELVNVIAGSLRGLMDSPGAMSTPFPLTIEELDRMGSLDERFYLVEQYPLRVLRI